MLKKYLDKKGKVNFKIYDVRAWLTTIAIQILPNISRSKNNQAMKIDQVIEPIRIVFFKNHSENESGRLLPNLFCFSRKLYMR